jgi:hypothetical protein
MLCPALFFGHGGFGVAGAVPSPAAELSGTLVAFLMSRRLLD